MIARWPLLASLVAVGLAGGCDQSTASLPSPREPTGQEIGYSCRMALAEHTGPKAQIFLAGEAEPLWFSSVRDALIHARLEAGGRAISAFYVNDMGRATWNQPEPGTWIEAKAAVFVVGSHRGSGMDGAEVVPFSTRQSADTFTAEYGGRVAALTAITDQDLFARTQAPDEKPGGTPSDGR